MALVLGAPFGSHMVIQRGEPIRFWGWDEPGRPIRIVLESPEGKALFEGTVVTDPTSGAFACTLPALEPRGPYRLRVSGSESVTLDDVLAGDVWLASGQSNMEWTVSQAADAEREIAAAQFPSSRCLYVARNAAAKPARTVGTLWFSLTPETAPGVTAVGYFFARELQRALDVPIGIIDASWGGTRIEAWTSAEALAAVMPLAEDRARYELSGAALAAVTGEYAERLRRWEAENLAPDPRNEGEARGFARSDFDDGDWRAMRVPGMWQRAGMAFNGAVWFRKWFELPRDFAGQELLLSLGPIDDFDHTYLNGVLVGAHPKGTDQAYQIPRCYSVPAGVLREGKNLLAVRVFDHVGEGGFVGPSSALFVERARQPGVRVPLAGEFKVGVERAVPLIPLDVFKTYPPIPLPLQPQNAPAALHNGMLAPLVPFGMRGVIFYQGEANTWEPEHYATRFRAFIRDLRARFEKPLPFYYVELAGYREHDGWPLLREAQADALAEPETGMASAIDLGDPNDIHPKNKLDVGRRLAALALARTYGRADVRCSGPVMSDVTLGEEARVRFVDAEGLHTTDGEPPRAFEVAGPERDFVPANARIAGTAVIVTSERVRSITAVRYAFRDYADVNLVNDAGLPARPFRTDRA